MIEIGDDNLVARLPSATERPAQGERVRRHVRAEGNATGIRSSEKVGESRVGVVKDLITATAGFERPAVVGVAVSQIVADSVDDTLRGLAACRPVEEDGGTPSNAESERGELGANVLDVERCRHEFWLARYLTQQTTETTTFSHSLD
jgi:hypothetical protein